MDEIIDFMKFISGDMKSLKIYVLDYKKKLIHSTCY